MTSKLSWITFIPFTIAAICIKLAQIFYVDADGMVFGLPSNIWSYISIGCIVLVLLFALLFSLLDKKTAQYYVMKRNIPIGIISVVLAIVLASDGANNIFSLFDIGDISVAGVVDSALTLLISVVFIVIGLSHFVGTGTSKGMAIFYLMPALWSAIRLVRVFLKYTKVSIQVTDVCLLASYILLTLFLFNFAILASYIKGKSPVKTTIIYGFPACTALLMYGTYGITDLVVADNFDLFSNLYIFELALFGLYILLFLIELTFTMKTKDEIRIIEDENIDNDENNEVVDQEDKLLGQELITGKESEIQENLPVHSYLETQDTSNFIVTIQPESDDYAEDSEEKAEDELKGFLTDDKNEINKSQKETSQNVYEKRMDEIDKLILDISEDIRSG